MHLSRHQWYRYMPKSLIPFLHMIVTTTKILKDTFFQHTTHLDVLRILLPSSVMQNNTAILLEERSLVICTPITHISFVRILTAQIKAFPNEGLHFSMTDMYFVVIPSCNCFITVMLN